MRRYIIFNQQVETNIPAYAEMNINISLGDDNEHILESLLKNFKNHNWKSKAKRAVVWRRFRRDVKIFSIYWHNFETVHFRVFLTIFFPAGSVVHQVMEIQQCSFRSFLYPLFDGLFFLDPFNTLFFIFRTQNLIE